MFFVITSQHIIPHDYSEMKKNPSLPVVCKSCLNYVICVCLRIVVSNTYCAVLLL